VRGEKRVEKKREEKRNRERERERERKRRGARKVGETGLRRRRNEGGWRNTAEQRLE